MGAKKKKPIIIDKQSQPWLFKEQDEDEKKKEETKDEEADTEETYKDRF